MERLGARSKTAYRESGTNRFDPTIEKRDTIAELADYLKSSLPF
jgi:hypothetical protein